MLVVGRVARRGQKNMKSIDKFVRDQRAKKALYLIKKYNLPLIRAIASRMNHTMSVAIDLLDINVIPERVYSEFSKTVNQCDPLVDMIFASSLMSRVRVALQRDPESFPIIMNSFRKHSPLNEVVVRMEKEYYGENYYATPIYVILSVAGSVLVGLLAIILAYILWPSSSAVQCTDVFHNQTLIQKLASVDIANLTSCWSQYDEGIKLLENYKIWCNQTQLQTDESPITNETRLYLQDWCKIVDSISLELSSVSTENGNESTEDLTNVWCRDDIITLLECLKSMSTTS
ncbi:PREDICTED: uncharacterized protein LOC109581118 [Amphimedon queenslandica]|uniref:Uncharacterized protein n=2 Tax=Amphimedon queenslandica TaxID=400682 RepID=A0AAN0J169_AMPQE|nr:PREDICTED: uncharacterized protein LOC109581118 [Amphimedon queenslandica]|eukprot:XP_019850483.1 PREDICTED: uncharacterized protein LOC109581118 [Amphimedon queenslandica]